MAPEAQDLIWQWLIPSNHEKCHWVETLSAFISVVSKDLRAIAKSDKKVLHKSIEVEAWRDFSDSSHVYSVFHILHSCNIFTMFPGNKWDGLSEKQFINLLIQYQKEKYLFNISSCSHSWCRCKHSKKNKLFINNTKQGGQQKYSLVKFKFVIESWKYLHYNCLWTFEGKCIKNFSFRFFAAAILIKMNRF